MKLRPLGDHVIVKAAPKEEMTKSGIVLTESARKDGPEQGEVIEVGPGRLLESGARSSMSLKVGDKIMFEKSYAAKTIKIDDAEHLVISESDVIAVIE